MLKTQIKPASVKFLEWSALGLVLATVIDAVVYKYAQINMSSYFYGLMLIIASVFLMMEIGVMHYFKKSTYKKLHGHEVIGIAIGVIAGIMLLSGLVAMPFLTIMMPMALQGILFGTNIITGILAILSLVYVILTK